jgi:hypothetical protein
MVWTEAEQERVGALIDQAVLKGPEDRWRYRREYRDQPENVRRTLRGRAFLEGAKAHKPGETWIEAATRCPYCLDLAESWMRGWRRAGGE